MNAASNEKQPHEIKADNYFAILPEWILDSDVSANAIRLFALLNRYANAQGTCFPKQETLAARMRVSDDTVSRAAKELIAIGAITVTHRKKSNGFNTSNLYTLRMTAPHKTAATKVAEDESVTAEESTRTLADTSNHPAPMRVYNPAPMRPGSTAPVRVKSESVNQSHYNESHPKQSVEKTAEMITNSAWLPYAKFSGQSKKAVIKVTTEILKEGRVDHDLLTKAIKRLASHGEPIIGWRVTKALAEVAGIKPAITLKGSLSADQKVDWDAQTEAL